MPQKYELLDLMMQDMQKQSDLYKPTSFWEVGSKSVINSLEENDIKDFRSLQSPRSFFVPGYSFEDYLSNSTRFIPLWIKFTELTLDRRIFTRIKRLLSGHTDAFANYRVLKASNINKHPFTDKVSESRVGNPLEQETFDGRNFSRSFLNYLLGLNFIKHNVDTSNIKTVMEIGGGFGSLGEILLGDERNNCFYINADIPPVSFVSAYYLKELFGSKDIADYGDLKNLETLDINELKNQYKAINLCAWQVPKLQGKIDLFVNFISFQEMEPEVVENYCNYINKLEPKYILLRNMLEGKATKSQTHSFGVTTPILGNDYDKFIPEYELITVDTSVFGFLTEDGFHSQLRLYKRK